MQFFVVFFFSLEIIASPCCSTFLEGATIYDLPGKLLSRCYKYHLSFLLGLPLFASLPPLLPLLPPNVTTRSPLPLWSLWSLSSFHCFFFFFQSKSARWLSERCLQIILITFMSINCMSAFNQLNIIQKMSLNNLGKNINLTFQSA